MTDDLLKRLLQPPFGTETSERNLMAEAAVRILELEAASARARNDALGEAAGCIGHITRHEDLDAIFALRTQPPPTASVEPVTAPTTAQLMADERVRALVDALENAIAANPTELNLGNYGHDDVCKLQDEAIDMYQILTAALAQLKEPT